MGSPLYIKSISHFTKKKKITGLSAALSRKPPSAGFPDGTVVKNPPANTEVEGDGFNPWRREMATHFSILAWRIPWTEEPGGYSPWGHRVRDDLATER